MVEIKTKQGMEMCPMAIMCKGIAQKPPSLPIMLLPGLIIIALGVVILLEPKILVWLVATVTIIFGLILIIISIWMRRMFAHFQDFNHPP